MKRETEVFDEQSPLIPENDFNSTRWNLPKEFLRLTAGAVALIIVARLSYTLGKVTINSIIDFLSQVPK